MIIYIYIYIYVYIYICIYIIIYIYIYEIICYFKNELKQNINRKFAKDNAQNMQPRNKSFIITHIAYSNLKKIFRGEQDSAAC